MPIICFFGTDGAGKSTLAEALSMRLHQDGFKTKRSWMRGTHTLASLLAKFFSKLLVFRGSSNPYYGITIPLELRRLWQLIEFASALPIIIVRFVIPSSLGWWIIAERYTPDFIAWVTVTTNHANYLNNLEAKFLLALSSKAKEKIYVTATVEELSRRRKETNLAFLRRQVNLYSQIASAIDAHCIDTTNKTVDVSITEALTLLNVP